jgi:hypothetical protein
MLVANMAPTNKKAARPANRHDQNHHTQPDPAITVLALTQGAANGIVKQPKHKQKGQGSANGGARSPVVHLFVDQKTAGVEQIQHREQCKTTQPSGITFPIRPMQVVWQRQPIGRYLVFVGMVKTATVY